MTILSSPQEKRYGWRGDTASPRTVEMCPVSVRRRLPEARSQIFTVRSPAPVQNHWFPGSTASARTQPRCPEITRMSFQGGCQIGLICWAAALFLRTRLLPGNSLCAVPAPAPPPTPAPLLADDGRPRIVNDVDVGADAPPALAATPSIIFIVLPSTPSASVNSGFETTGATPPPMRFAFFAVACFAASAGGSSRTVAYSRRILQLMDCLRLLDISAS